MQFTYNISNFGPILIWEFILFIIEFFTQTLQ